VIDDPESYGADSADVLAVTTLDATEVTPGRHRLHR
jgi:hypothetical protein